MSDNNKFIPTTIKYCGYNDFGGGLFVKEVCDNIGILEKSIEDFNKDISTVEDVYRFLWCLSFKEMIKDIDYFKIGDVLKSRILHLNKAIDLPVASFVQAINKNYRAYFNKCIDENVKWVEFFYELLEKCYEKYNNSISRDVFSYLEEKYPLHILSHFDYCSKYYSKQEKAFKTLFNGVESTGLFDDQIYLRFMLTTSNKDDPFLKSKAAFICERTLVEIRKMNLTEDDKNILQVQSMIQDYAKLANMYKLKCSNEYAVMKKDIQKKLDEFIRKHGEHRKLGPVDLKTAIDVLKRSENKYKFLQLTHVEDENNRIIDALDNIFKEDNRKNPLSEAFNDISRNRSEKYPYYKQDSMMINLWIRQRMINLIICDEKLFPEFANYVYNVSLQLQDEYFNNLIDIEKEVTGVVDCLWAIIDLTRRDEFDTPFGKMLVYSTSLSICSTIEKILRNVGLKEVKDDIYVNMSKVTMAHLFKRPFKLNDVSKGLKYYLEFYLIREVCHGGDEMDRPGLNIRNNIMHGQDDAYEQTNYGTCLTLFYFLLSLLDDLFIASKESNNENL